MSTLRDAIETRINELTQSSGPVIFAFDNPGDAADDILALVREALLGDEAISRMIFVAQCEEHPHLVDNGRPVMYHTALINSYRTGLTVALDMITGEQP